MNDQLPDDPSKGLLSPDGTSYIGHRAVISCLVAILMWIVLCAVLIRIP